jgi:hypothetical protein
MRGCDCYTIIDDKRFDCENPLGMDHNSDHIFMGGAVHLPVGSDVVTEPHKAEEWVEPRMPTRPLWPARRVSLWLMLRAAFSGTLLVLLLAFVTWFLFVTFFPQ